jgi:hypothetical protein
MRRVPRQCACCAVRCCAIWVRCCAVRCCAVCLSALAEGKAALSITSARRTARIPAAAHCGGSGPRDQSGGWVGWRPEASWRPLAVVGAGSGVAWSGAAWSGAALCCFGVGPTQLQLGLWGGQQQGCTYVTSQVCSPNELCDKNAYSGAAREAAVAAGGRRPCRSVAAPCGYVPAAIQFIILIIWSLCTNNK